MKNFKKIIIPILILIIIIIILLFFNNQNKKTNNTISDNTNNNVLSSSNIIDDEDRANFSGENAVIYLGTHSQYEPFTIILDKTLSDEELSKNIILKISELIGYKIELSSLTIEDNKIYVDFSKDYAPFNIEGSIIESEEKLYSIYGNDNLVYTVFDSIYKSLTSYFGNEYTIFFSVNSENINITFDNFNFSIDSSVPYELYE